MKAAALALCALCLWSPQAWAQDAACTPRALGEMAIAHASDADHETAIELLEAAAAIDDHSDEARTVAIITNLATAYGRVGRDEDAARVLEETLGDSAINIPDDLGAE